LCHVFGVVEFDSNKRMKHEYAATTLKFLLSYHHG
jgi:hypothetical protein